MISWVRLRTRTLSRWRRVLSRSLILRSFQRLLPCYPLKPESGLAAFGEGPCAPASHHRLPLALPSARARSLNVETDLWRVVALVLSRFTELAENPSAPVSLRETPGSNAVILPVDSIWAGVKANWMLTSIARLCLVIWIDLSLLNWWEFPARIGPNCGESFDFYQELATANLQHRGRHL